MSFDELLINAIHICKEYDEVSPPVFQRKLMVDYDKGLKIFKELIGLGIISKYWLDEFDEDRENLIGKVDKNKLKEYLTN